MPAYEAKFKSANSGTQFHMNAPDWDNGARYSDDVVRFLLSGCASPIYKTSGIVVRSI